MERDVRVSFPISQGGSRGRRRFEDDEMRLYRQEWNGKANTCNSLAPLLKSTSAGFYKALRPLANAYARAAGHRQVGLRYDDLIWEEQDDVQKVSVVMSGRNMLRGEGVGAGGASRRMGVQV